jgi:hypothetical protein
MTEIILKGPNEINLIILYYIIQRELEITKENMIIIKGEQKVLSRYITTAEIIMEELKRTRKFINMCRKTRRDHYKQYLKLEQIYNGKHYCSNCENINIGKIAIWHQDFESTYWITGIEETFMCRNLLGKSHKRTILIETSNIEEYEKIRDKTIDNYQKLKEANITKKVIINKTIHKERCDIKERRKYVKMNSYDIVIKMYMKEWIKMIKKKVWTGQTFIDEYRYQTRKTYNEPWKDLYDGEY